MRICLIGPTYPFRGGIAHYTTMLCRQLRRKHEVKFISFSRQYPAWLFPGATDRDTSGEPIEAGDVERIIDSLNPFTWSRAADEIRDFKPDLVVVPWWVAFWTPVFVTICKRVKRETPAELVFLCHNVVEHESNPLKRWCTRHVLDLGDRCIVHSGEDGRNLLSLLPDANVEVGFLPTFMDLATHPAGKSEAKSFLHLDGDVILFFGFVRPYKGLDVLLDAMSRVRKETGASLLIVGEFWKNRSDYFARIAERGLEDAVQVVDRYVPNEDIPLYFGACDVVALPYRSGTGSAVAQLAFALERPIVATTVGCLPEVVRDGVDGALVPPEDPDALADVLIRSLAPRRLSELTRGARRAKERFSWEEFARLLTG